MKVAFSLFISLLLSLVAAQEPFYQIPANLVQVEPGAVTLRALEGSVTYVEGLGWRTPSDLPAPLIVENEAYATTELLTALGVNLPRLNGVRVGGSGTVRLVLDLGGASEASLTPLERKGRLQPDEVLRLRLPALLLPFELPDPYRGVELELSETALGTDLSLRAGEATYDVFALGEPTRLVIDVTPVSYAEVEEKTVELRPGVVYKNFAAPTGIGSSEVHAVELSPQAGEFRVVGESEEPGPVSRLASGAFAAINAGYFDTKTFDAIGLLKVDHGLLSLPSRSRASIGFGLETVIDRVAANLSVRLGSKLYSTSTFAETVQVYTSGGRKVGQPTQGVITVANGRVTANRIGPLTVPEDGFALVYEPKIRDLALVNEGDPASYSVTFQPASFGTSRYAVEAGPLLVAQGRPAFEPDREQFERGQRILDQYTQQAAVGVKADGTVLFVAADNMIAEELIPLMLSLGAEQAMRLDSGGSTTLFVDGEVVNRERERRVVSAIVFVPYAN